MNKWVGALLIVGTLIFAGGMFMLGLNKINDMNSEASEYNLTHNGPRAPMFMALKTHYPNEWQDFNDHMREAVSQSNQDLSEDEIFQISNAAIKPIIEQVARDAYKADKFALTNLAQATYNTVEIARQTDIALCATLATKRDLPLEAGMGALDAARTVQGVKFVEAGANGRNSPARAVTPFDGRAWSKALIASGITEREVFTLFQSQLPTDQCRLGLLMLKASQLLPEDQMARYIVGMPKSN